MILGMSAEPSDLPALYDRYRGLGGNAFDSARWYPGEPTLGHWLAGRADRDDLVVIGKVCHPTTQDGPPRVTPEVIARELAESLDRLGLARIDLLFLHRDDPSVPVGELLTALEAERVAGRVAAYGASNWTTDRLADADAWARSRGIPGFAASSPNLSLAVPVRPPWPGCVTAGDPASLAWYERTSMPLVAWTPLARGWFADPPRDPAGLSPDDANVLAAFDSAANRERHDRARALAYQLGASATQVALAWVLQQPFPTWAVVGARTVAELEESAPAARLRLAPVELEALSGAV